MTRSLPQKLTRRISVRARLAAICSSSSAKPSNCSAKCHASCRTGRLSAVRPGTTVSHTVSCVFATRTRTNLRPVLERERPI
jgi:hypothetical protein